MTGSTFQRIRLQIFEANEFDRGGVRCFKIDRGRATMIKRSFPARDADAPFIAGLEPGKPHSGCGVTKSFPSSTEKSRNSRVTLTQTVCRPRSSGPVRQNPSRKNPVIGSRQQHFRSVPRTFVGITIARWLNKPLGHAKSGSSVEMVDSPAGCCSACSTARQASIAHLTRSGNFRTPCISRRSPSVLGASAASSVTNL